MSAWVKKMNSANRVKSLIAKRQIIKSMAIKNLKGKYVSSALGISWAIINPLLIMFAVTFVFTLVMKTEIKHFPLLVLSALLPWSFFINSICESTASMKQNIGMLNQFIIPREAIPISIVLANFANFLFGFIVMLPIFIIFNTGIFRYLWLLPLIMFLHFTFALGVSIFFSIVNVYFKDLSQLLNVGVMLWFWLTPIFYPLTMIPAKYRWIIIINPGTCYVEIYRSLLYRASGGDMYMWALAIGFALVSIIIGHALFIRKEAEILKYI